MPKNEQIEMIYPMFDGEKVWENARVVIGNGIITEITAAEGEADTGYFLMPGLIDSHTHMDSEEQITAMLQNGITTTCDVSASAELIQSSRLLHLHSSAGMAMGVVLSGRNYVEKAMRNGAKYIKVLLFDRNTISKSALKSIVSIAHENGLKVAAHATAIATVQLAVDCGVDILLHVPMKEPFPRELAEMIAEKGIAVTPTLVMMETFANSGRSGYKTTDYPKAEEAVKLLYDCGVEILAATDSNNGSFAPAVVYGASIHREMELLVKAGLTPTEVLAAATSKNAKVFGLEAGRIAVGAPATMVLVEGRPNQLITDSKNIKAVWVNGSLI